MTTWRQKIPTRAAFCGDLRISRSTRKRIFCGVRLSIGPQDEVRTSVKAHVSLTHKNKKVLEAADLLVTLLFAIAEGQSLRDALKDQAHAWLSTTKAATWVSRPDT